MYLRCLELAQDNIDTADRYYEHTPLSVIYEKYALRLVKNYTPPVKPTGKKNNDFE